MGLPDFNADPSAAASSGIVLLQLQSLSVLSFIAMVLDRFNRLCFLCRFFFLWLRDQKRLPGMLQPRKQLLGNRLCLGVIVDIGGEAEPVTEELLARLEHARQ